MMPMNHAPITAILLHKNADNMLRRAVESVRWCQEIIIIDDSSQVPPNNIAKEYNAKLLSRKLDSFADQRNFGLHQATQPWVLYIDADECVSDALHQEIIHAITQPHQGFLFSRQDIFMGKILRFGETNAIRFLRLAKKEAGLWSRTVHEYWNVQGSIGVLHTPIMHTPHASLATFFDKMNQYTELEVVERKSMKKKFLWREFTIFPFAKFLYNYILRLGCMDGFPGLCMAYMMSLHSLIIRIKMHE